MFSKIEPKVLQASSPIVVQASPVVLGRGSGILLPRHLSGCREGLAPPASSHLDSGLVRGRAGTI